jgi:hypothetical protein
VPISKTIVISFIACSLIAFTTCSQTSTNQGAAPAFTVEKIGNLSSDITESSGLIFYDSLLWTFNDGGHGAILYGINLNSGITDKKIPLPNANNVDWEDITQDASSIYIGDIGNNWGNRRDLCIYKISKSGFLGKKKKGIKVHKINYTYPDQNYFTYKFDDTPYDCEALICIADSLILFTKNWKTHQSVVYSVPVYPGDYVAHKIIEFDSKGLVTGADYDPLTGNIAICGHKNHIPFVMIFKLIDLMTNNQGNFKRYDLNDLMGAQIEGIAFYNNSIYLSSEKNTVMPALFRLRIKLQGQNN